MKIRERQGKITVEVTDKTGGSGDDNSDLAGIVSDRSYTWPDEWIAERADPEQRQCNFCFTWKESYQEVSDTTGFSMLQVKSYIQNGKRNLKILIERKLKEKS